MCIMLLLIGGILSILSSFTEVEVSDRYTTHILFSQEVIYTDLGQPTIIADYAEGNENILRVKAVKPFEGRTNISVVLKDGTFITYYVVYKDEPESLVYDNRKSDKPLEPNFLVEQKSQADTITKQPKQETQVDTLSYLSSLPAQLTHIGTRQDKVDISVASIYIHNSQTFITYTIHNRSNLPLEVDGHIHTYKQNIKSRKAVYQSIELYPSMEEELEPILPGNKKSVTYRYDNLFLTPSQQLSIDIYATDNRTYVFHLSQDDLTHAIKIPEFYDKK